MDFFFPHDEFYQLLFISIKATIMSQQTKIIPPKDLGLLQDLAWF